MQALLSLGAAVNARDRSGGTPLSVTAEEDGRTGAAAALLAAGADVRAKNAAGEAPMYIASLRGHVAMVQLLLQFHEREGISWTVRPQHLCSGGLCGTLLRNISMWCRSPESLTHASYLSEKLRTSLMPSKQLPCRMNLSVTKSKIKCSR